VKVLYFLFKLFESYDNARICERQMFKFSFIWNVFEMCLKCILNFNSLLNIFKFTISHSKRILYFTLPTVNFNSIEICNPSWLAWHLHAIQYLGFVTLFTYTFYLFIDCSTFLWNTLPLIVQSAENISISWDHRQGLHTHCCGQWSFIIKMLLILKLKIY
jgi:hypothetical protein